MPGMDVKFWTKALKKAEREPRHGNAAQRRERPLPKS
jgi:hypothetical protein